MLDRKKPETVLNVSDAPALTPEAPYEIEHGEIPQVAPANFKTGSEGCFRRDSSREATISWFTMALPTYR